MPQTTKSELINKYLDRIQDLLFADQELQKEKIHLYIQLIREQLPIRNTKPKK